MLSSNLTVADEVNAAFSFVLNNQNGQRTTRIATSSTLAAPKLLTIDHTVTGKAGSPSQSDRHLVQFSKAGLDANGVPFTTVVNLTCNVPRNATAGDVDELVGHVINFIIGTDAARTLGNLDNLLLGES